VFMGGSRLTKFMESVEKATDSIPTPVFGDGDGQWERGPSSRPRSMQTPPPPTASAADPWAGLLQTGLALLQNLQGATQPGVASRSGASLVERDPKTGESYLRLPMPKPEVMQQVMQALSALAQALGR